MRLLLIQAASLDLLWRVVKFFPVLDDDLCLLSFRPEIRLVALAEGRGFGYDAGRATSRDQFLIK